VTAEVLDVLLPQLDTITRATYDFSRALQGPVFDMGLRGVLIDKDRRDEVVEKYGDQLEKLEHQLDMLVGGVTGIVGFNWRSPKQLSSLFYDTYGIKEIKNRDGNRTVNQAALEKLKEYELAYPIVKYMERMRELGKLISVLKTELDHDGRIRTSYNIAGTSTGRFSSSFSEFGTGTNLQNIDPLLRSIFIADKGMKLANFDAAQGESRIVGAIEWNLFHDGKYLDACETEDVHMTVANMCGLGPKDRQVCKIIGHGSNYGGKPDTLSTQAANHGVFILPPAVQKFQNRYFRVFPAHRMWHAWVEQQIQHYGWLISLTGRKRYFFGRRDNPDTLRKAIDYDPQGSLADIVNQGMLRVWSANDCQLLMQNHDSILVQYPEEMEDEIVPKVQAQLFNEVPLKYGRTLVMPYDCEVGWNWGKHGEDNPDGLKKYRPGDKRTRTAEV